MDAVIVLIPIGFRFVRKNAWLVSAVLFECLGLLAAFGAIPGLTGYTPWMLAATGILSCTGVVIVTVYFMMQYNRRPLNAFQLEQLEKYLSDYTLTVNLMEDLKCRFETQASQSLPKSLTDFSLFWIWRYQKSVMEFAWSSKELHNYNKPGQVLVAKLDIQSDLVREIQFTVLPPPFDNLGPCLRNEGEILPTYYGDWGSILREHETVILYITSDGELKFLRWQGGQLVFNREFAAPVIVNASPITTPITTMPRLVRKSSNTGNDIWEWQMQDAALET